MSGMLLFSTLSITFSSEPADVCLHVASNLELNAPSLSLLSLRTRRRILKTNERLAHEAAGAATPSSTSDSRDQGFTRPKVLLLLPFRSTALLWISTLVSLFPAGTQTENQSRFLEEFSLPDGVADRLIEKAGEFPKDHVDTFKGNVDDNFRVGVKVTRKAVKLFSGFYGSDIVIGSPLGLRMSIEREKSVRLARWKTCASAEQCLSAGAPTSSHPWRSSLPTSSTA